MGKSKEAIVKFIDKMMADRGNHYVFKVKNVQYICYADKKKDNIIVTPSKKTDERVRTFTSETFLSFCINEEEF